ncbi:MAG: ferredoxin [Desulfurococcaceae archaeon]|uniref:Ferredoxin n=1 Tax=Staphylothermus marinus TaxID=2280 RepID=A0A7C4JLN0_STAMA
MAKYRVRIDPRDNCIGDMVCVSICPDVFEINTEDNKVQIVSRVRVEGNIAIGEVGEDLKDCVKDAATACPVQIIHVEEI